MAEEQPTVVSPDAGGQQTPPAKPVVTPAVEQPVVAQPTPATLPQDTSERTREQFDKLLESNKRLLEANESLKEEMQSRAKAEQMFAPVAPPPPVPQVDPNDFIEADPVTGEQYINEQKLKTRIAEVQQRANRAEQAVQNYVQASEQREIDKQNQEAFGAYPELDPNGEKFDKELHNQTRAAIYDSLLNPQDYKGRPLTFKEAADLVKTRQVKTPGEVPPEGGETQALKEQGSLSATGQPQVTAQPSGDEELEDLRLRTRLGDDEAIAKRLMNVPHTGTPTSSAEEAS